MTPDEFAQRMTEIAQTITDPEWAHAEAIGLMCSLLNEMGYHKGVTLFTDKVQRRLAYEVGRE